MNLFLIYSESLTHKHKVGIALISYGMNSSESYINLIFDKMILIVYCRQTFHCNNKKAYY